jgi:hypothetical protein
MVNGATWEEETLARLRNAQKDLKNLEEQRKQAEQRIAYLTQYTEALEKVLELEQQGRAVKVNGEQAVDSESLRKKSVREALIEIAGRNNGLLVVQDALRILLRVGVLQNQDQGRNAIYSALHYAKSDFQRERPGVYRLTDRAQAQPTFLS